VFPRRTAGMVSDGLRILMLLRGNQEAEQLSLLMMLQGASKSGQRPRDWNPSVLERVLSLRGDALTDGAASLMAYYHYLDRGDVARASAMLDRALESMAMLVPMLQAGFLLEATYFEAWHRHNADTAQALFAQVATNALVEKQSRLRAEAALLFAKGDKAAAEARAREGLQAVKDSYDLGGAKAEADWLREIVAATQ
jgi:hypothetical protein